jgi:LacI family transcriptional regulator, galactose operon repressor
VTKPARPTLADVAARAGVSLKTASRALNGEYGVAEPTAERVREAAGQLSFRLNHLARALATRQTSATVGLVIPTVSDPFFAALAAEVESTLAPRELGLISASHGDDIARQRMLTRALVERRVDALIFVSAPGDSSHLQLDIDHGLAVGAVDRPLEGVSVDTVTIDNRGAARVAVTELVTAGHRRIAAIGYDARLWTMSERYDGYRDALVDAEISLDADLVALSCGDAEQAEATVIAMLQASDPPTAVFALHNRSGRAAIRSMLATGAEVDLSVFDDVTDPDLLVIPPLTVVASEPRRLGAAVAAMTLERLDGLAAPARDVVLPPLFQHPRASAVSAEKVLDSRRRAFGVAQPRRAQTRQESR